MTPGGDMDEGSPTAEGEDDCGWADLGCKAKQAITGWFQTLASAALEPVMGTLAVTQFATPEIGSDPMKRTEQIWTTSLAIADTCFVLLVTFAGVLLMTGQTFAGETSPSQVVPRLVLAFVAMNTSLIWIGYGIRLANGLASAILMNGTDRINPDQAGAALAGGIEASINTGGAFYTIVSLIVVVLAAILLFQYVTRLAITMVLIAVAPIALMFHVLPLTDGLAQLWWRGISGTLAIQVCQSFVFITALQLLLSQESDSEQFFVGLPTNQAELVDLLLIIALLFILVRIPRWVARTVWQSTQSRTLRQLVKTLVLYKAVGAVTRATRRATHGGSGPRPSTRNAGAGRPRPGPGPGGRGHGRGGPQGSPNGGPNGGPGPQPDRAGAQGGRSGERHNPDRNRARHAAIPSPRNGQHTAGRTGTGAPHRPGHDAASQAIPRPRPSGLSGPGRPTGDGRPRPPVPPRQPARPYRRADSPHRPAPRTFVRLDPPQQRRHARRHR
ncbi:type IV secretion system protein [Actinomadura spongiicola]|nr:type IV secretion system protein [Actinomadura spongiicola]